MFTLLAEAVAVHMQAMPEVPEALAGAALATQHLLVVQG